MFSVGVVRGQCHGMGKKGFLESGYIISWFDILL